MFYFQLEERNLQLETELVERTRRIQQELLISMRPPEVSKGVEEL
jgi:hypothetical protein